MIVYLARDIPAFVVYCERLNEESGSSLLIQSTDSMISSTYVHVRWQFSSRMFSVRKQAVACWDEHMCACVASVAGAYM